MVRNSFLLDTHVFIWCMEENKRLSEDIKKKIADPENKNFISVATVWEIIIKKTTKQIKFHFDLENSIKKTGFEVIPIQISHVLNVSELPLYHKDPFDRILISQAQVENLVFITSDEKIWKYNVAILRC